MKSKIDMAHDYAMALVLSPDFDDDMSLSAFVKHVWKYADKMQAEADKRKVSGVPDAIRENSHIFGSIAPVRPFFTKDKDGNCMHFHHEFGHKKCMDCGDSLDDAKSQLDKMIHDDGLMLKEQARIKGANLDDYSFVKPYVPK